MHNLQKKILYSLFIPMKPAEAYTHDSVAIATMVTMPKRMVAIVARARAQASEMANCRFVAAFCDASMVDVACKTVAVLSR